MPFKKKSGAAETDNEFLFFDARTGAAIQKDAAGAAEQSELPADNETTIETAEEGDGQNTPELAAEQNDVQTENTWSLLRMKAAYKIYRGTVYWKTDKERV